MGSGNGALLRVGTCVLVLGSSALAFAPAACGARSGLISQTCTSLDAAGERSALVVFVMLDTSGSMAFETENGETKQKAVRDALAEFFADPASAGIGVAESFFPILRPGVPDNCRDDADCGEPGACFVHGRHACLPSGDKGCETDLDCSTGETCTEIGLCADDIEKVCIVGVDAYCNSGVPCRSMGSCLNQSSCDLGEYSEPPVEVGILPGARPKLVLGLDTRVSKGATPSLPAMQGALVAASQWQDAHPADKAIVLFATDGLPTVCDPAIPISTKETAEGVPKVAEAAASGVTQGVQTFVVGVFSAEEEQLATYALGTIAAAGGTDEAFVISTNDTVVERLLQTFNEIRDRADACEYSIPWPAEGSVDPSALTVTVGPALDAGGVAVSRVESKEACDPSLGGFYFDRAPAGGVLPHRVILCPATCGSQPPDVVHLEGGCRVERP